MSIINDALKKAEKQRDDSQITSPRVLRDISASNRSTARRWTIWAGTLVICLLALFIYLTPAQEKPIQIAAVVVEEPILSPEPVKSIFNLRSVDIETPVKTDELTLAGIVFDQKQSFAIINNKVVSEGSTIEGAQLLEIKPNFVRLSRKEKEFTLRIK